MIAYKVCFRQINPLQGPSGFKNVVFIEYMLVHTICYLLRMEAEGGG